MSFGIHTAGHLVRVGEIGVLVGEVRLLRLRRAWPIVGHRVSSSRLQPLRGLVGPSQAVLVLAAWWPVALASTFPFRYFPSVGDPGVMLSGPGINRARAWRPRQV
jgi:hypothetical protein